MDALPAIDARLLSRQDGSEITEAFAPVAKRTIRPIFQEILQKDRQHLDSIIGRKIGLKQYQIDKIYLEINNLVSARLKKAATGPTDDFQNGNID